MNFNVRELDTHTRIQEEMKLENQNVNLSSTPTSIMSWFTYCSLKLTVYVPPLFLENVEEGVKVQLRSKLFRWVPSLSGVFLSWKDIQILSNSAQVTGDVQPLIQVPVLVKVLIWRPEIGGIVQGRLVHKGSDFIAARVLGLWNAVIVETLCGGLDKDKVNEGDTVQFRILRLQVVNNLLSFEGTLVGDNVGIVSSDGELTMPKLKEFQDNSTLSHHNPKKRQRPSEHSSNKTKNENSDDDLMLTSPSHQNHKKRKSAKDGH